MFLFHSYVAVKFFFLKATFLLFLNLLLCEMRHHLISLLRTDQVFSVVNYMSYVMTYVLWFTNIYSLVPTSDLGQNFQFWVIQELRYLVLMIWLLSSQSLQQVSSEEKSWEITTAKELRVIMLKIGTPRELCFSERLFANRHISHWLNHLLNLKHILECISELQPIILIFNFV